MNKNILILAAAVAAVLMLNKAKAATAPAGAASAPAAVNNVNGDMWSKIMGGGWRLLTDAQNSDGSQAFLKSDLWGRITTSDGKPISQEYNEAMNGTAPLDFTLGGTDYLGGLPFAGYY